MFSFSELDNEQISFEETLTLISFSDEQRNLRHKLLKFDENQNNMYHNGGHR